VKLEKLKKEQERKKKEEEELKHMAWGQGLVQKKQQEENVRNIRELAAQPFARYKEDLAKDDDLKERERWGDPMAGLVKVGFLSVSWLFGMASSLLCSCSSYR